MKQYDEHETCDLLAHRHDYPEGIFHTWHRLFSKLQHMLISILWSRRKLAALVLAHRAMSDGFFR
jgi:hypothetical protein